MSNFVYTTKEDLIQQVLDGATIAMEENRSVHEAESKALAPKSAGGGHMAETIDFSLERTEGGVSYEGTVGTVYGAVQEAGYQWRATARRVKGGGIATPVHQDSNGRFVPTRIKVVFRNYTTPGTGAHFMTRPLKEHLADFAKNIQRKAQGAIR